MLACNIFQYLVSSVWLLTKMMNHFYSWSSCQAMECVCKYALQMEKKCYLILHMKCPLTFSCIVLEPSAVSDDQYALLRATFSIVQYINVESLAGGFSHTLPVSPQASAACSLSIVLLHMRFTWTTAHHFHFKGAVVRGPAPDCKCSVIILEEAILSERWRLCDI